MIELRDVDRTAWTLVGTATTWSYSEDRGAYFVHDPSQGVFLERMQRNCFADATSGRDAVELRREHDPNSAVYASTARGSLAFVDESNGLFMAGALSKADTATRSLVAEIRAGDLTGLSVGMVVRGDHWGTAADGRTALRTVTSATLNEVSVVRKPCNPDAGAISVRHELRGERIEYRSLPLVFRQMSPEGSPGYDDGGEDMVICPACDGSGMASDGDVCPVCDGEGEVPADEDNRAVASGDPQRSIPHLVASVRNDLAHAHRHIAALSEPGADVAFNADHAMRHITSGIDHAGKLDGKLTAYPSDPETYNAERLALKSMRSRSESRSRQETRRDFSDKEKAQHGKNGKAVYYDGGWHFPTPTRTDYDNAVKMVQLAPGKNRQKVRAYLVRRAKQEGWPVPSSWNSDGTVKRSIADTSAAQIDRFAAELALIEAGPSRLARAARGQTARDRAEQDWERARQSRNSEYLLRRFGPPRPRS